MKSTSRFARLGVKQFIKPINLVRTFAAIPPPSSFNLSQNSEENGSEEVPDIKTAFSNLYDVLSQSSLADNEMYQECKKEAEEYKQSLQAKYLFLFYS